MTEQEDVNGNDPTMVAPAAGSIFPANCIESLRQQNSRTVALLLIRQALCSEWYPPAWEAGGPGAGLIPSTDYDVWPTTRISPMCCVRVTPNVKSVIRVKKPSVQLIGLRTNREETTEENSSLHGF